MPDPMLYRRGRHLLLNRQNPNAPATTAPTYPFACDLELDWDYDTHQTTASVCGRKFYSNDSLGEIIQKPNPDPEKPPELLRERSQVLFAGKDCFITDTRIVCFAGTWAWLPEEFQLSDIVDVHGVDTGVFISTGEGNVVQLRKDYGERTMSVYQTRTAQVQHYEDDARFYLNGTIYYGSEVLLADVQNIRAFGFNWYQAGSSVVLGWGVENFQPHSLSVIGKVIDCNPRLWILTTDVAADKTYFYVIERGDDYSISLRAPIVFDGVTTGCWQINPTINDELDGDVFCHTSKAQAIVNLETGKVTSLLATSNIMRSNEGWQSGEAITIDSPITQLATADVGYENFERLITLESSTYYQHSYFEYIGQIGDGFFYLCNGKNEDNDLVGWTILKVTIESDSDVFTISEVANITNLGALSNTEMTVKAYDTAYVSFAVLTHSQIDISDGHHPDTVMSKVYTAAKIVNYYTIDGTEAGEIDQLPTDAGWHCMSILFACDSGEKCTAELVRWNPVGWYEISDENWDFNKKTKSGECNRDGCVWEYEVTATVNKKIITTNRGIYGVKVYDDYGRIIAYTTAARTTIQSDHFYVEWSGSQLYNIARSESCVAKDIRRWETSLSDVLSRKDIGAGYDGFRELTIPAEWFENETLDCKHTVWNEVTFAGETIGTSTKLMGILTPPSTAVNESQGNIFVRAAQDFIATPVPHDHTGNTSTFKPAKISSNGDIDGAISTSTTGYIEPSYTGISDVVYEEFYMFGGMKYDEARVVLSLPTLRPARERY